MRNVALRYIYELKDRFLFVKIYIQNKSRILFNSIDIDMKKKSLKSVQKIKKNLCLLCIEVEHKVVDWLFLEGKKSNFTGTMTQFYKA